MRGWSQLQEYIDYVGDALSRFEFLVLCYRKWYRPRLHKRQEYFIKLYGKTTSIKVGTENLLLDLAELHDTIILEYTIRSGAYEIGTLRILESLLRDGNTFLDVGANNGYFTVFAAPIVGQNGRVIAFEPNPSTFKRLERNATLNRSCHNIEINNVALSDHDGEATFYLSDYEDGLGSLVLKVGTPITVPLRCLDGLKDIREPIVVKIDAEGSELSILKGLEKFVSTNPSTRIIVEWNRQYATEELWRYLSTRFYTFMIRDVPKGAFIYPLPPGRRPHGIHNLLCVPIVKGHNQTLCKEILETTIPATWNIVLVNNTA
jgi:FkbM family methyltransferase